MAFVRLPTGAEYGPFDDAEKAEQWREAQTGSGYDAPLFENAEIITKKEGLNHGL
jgi:hypothetical protein